MDTLFQYLSRNPFTWIPPFTLISIIVNSVILVAWLRSKVLLDEFLVGRWEGTLKMDSPESSQDCLLIECTLMISKHKDAHDEGYLYYRKINLNDNRCLTEGLDKLDHYDGDKLFVSRRKWNPGFRRVFHKCKIHQDAPPAIYNFQCKVVKLFFRPCMRVRVEHSDRSVWVGHWSKH